MEKRETLQHILGAYVTEDPSRVLDATRLVRDITDRVPSDEAQEFLMFQSAIRAVPVGSILFAAHKSSDILRSAAKEKAVRQMTAGGIEQARATYAVDLLTDALGWNAEEEASAKPIEDVPAGTQAESNPPDSQRPMTEDATQVMPPVHDTIPQTHSEAPHPEWNQELQNPVQEKRKKQTVLLAILAVLVVIGIGVGVHFHQMDSQFAAKCKEAEKVTTDVRDFLAEIDELKGDPDGDDVKEYFDRLDKATSNLDQLASDLTSMRVSGKDDAKKKALVEAVLFEKGILDDTSTVIKNPGDKRTGELTDKIRDNTKKLDDLAENLTFDTVDFKSAMKLDGLSEKLYGYVKKYRSIAVQKREEEMRKHVQKINSKTVGGAVVTGEVLSRDKSDGVSQRAIPFVKLSDAAVSQKINADIEQSISSILPKSTDNLQWEKLTFEVKCDTGYTISIVVREDYLPDRAMHDAIRYVTLNYDKKTGARRTLNEYAPFTQEVAMQKARTELISYQSGASATKYFLDKSQPKMDKFFVTQDGHVWALFEPYEIAAFAAGATCLQAK